MIRGLGAVAVVVLAAGCAADEKPAPPKETTPPAVATSTPSPAARGSASVVVGDYKHPINGPITCTETDGAMVIKIGDQLYGLNVTVVEGDPLDVRAVGLGVVGGLTYGVGTSSGSLYKDGTADVVKDGNTYTITGDAIGRYPGDIQSPPRTAPYEVVVTCPVA